MRVKQLRGKFLRLRANASRRHPYPVDLGATLVARCGRRRPRPITRGRRSHGAERLELHERHERRPPARPHHRRHVRPDRRRGSPTTRRSSPATRASATPTAQLRDEVDRCARALIALGVDKGQRVGIWAPNCAEWTITQFATAKIGAILVNINPSYRLNEVQYALNQSGCAWLVTAPRFKTSDYTAMIHELAPELAGSQPGALEAANFPDLRGVVRLGDEPSPGMLGWGALLALAERVGADELARRQRQQEFDDPINIQYTSGTTGYPKGATLSHHNILNNGYFATELLRFTDRDRLLIPVPLYHCFGMVMGNLGCMTHGATMIYPSDGFDPTAVLEAAQAERRHRALRRADDVHRRAEPSRLRAIRPLHAAHRHHGRLALPGRGDEAGAGADAHARGGDRLRHDRDQPGQHADAHRGAAGQAGRHGGAGAPARADQDRRSADRAGGAGRASAASCARAATA